MKKTTILLLLAFQVSFLVAQDDITKTKEFESLMSVRADTKVEKCTFYYKKGKVLEGYMAYEAADVDPNFLYSDYTRFRYLKDGKLKLERISTDKIDSFLLGDRIYRKMDIKLSNGLISLTEKDAIYRVVENFEKTAIIKYVPNELGFGESDKDQKPTDILWNKTNNKFFQPETGLGNFTKGLKKIFEDCPSLTEEIQANKDAEPKTSILKKALTDDTQKNFDTLIEACKKYDNCTTVKKK
jgi:hypothetical protein